MARIPLTPVLLLHLRYQFVTSTTLALRATRAAAFTRLETIALLGDAVHLKVLPAVMTITVAAQAHILFAMSMPELV